MFQLYVSGLAEGRSSVLKGDIIKCIWKARQYSGRVDSTEQLCINMEIHSIFHRLFNVNIDRIEHGLFTFTRTPFRASHTGIGMAPQHMHQSMLMPTNNDTNKQVRLELTTLTLSELCWTSGLLNIEQKKAVHEIIKDSCRPMPYIVFGPSGTG